MSAHRVASLVATFLPLLALGGGGGGGGAAALAPPPPPPPNAPTAAPTRVEEFSSGALTARLLYSLPPIEVAGARYPQRGRFVFHSDRGTTRVLISRAAGRPVEGPEYYLSRF